MRSETIASNVLLSSASVFSVDVPREGTEHTVSHSVCRASQLLFIEGHTFQGSMVSLRTLSGKHCSIRVGATLDAHLGLCKPMSMALGEGRGPHNTIGTFPHVRLDWAGRGCGEGDWELLGESGQCELVVGGSVALT